MNTTTTPLPHRPSATLRHRRSRRFPRRSLAIAAAALIGLSACGSDAAIGEPAIDDSVTIIDAWSREPAAGQTTSAVYGIVTNNTGSTITAVGASTSVTGAVELHEVLMNDAGQMTMQQRDGGFAIEPGGALVFEPGGPHIMLLGIDPATYPDTVDVTLDFDEGTKLAFTAEVRPIGADITDDTNMDDSGGS